MTQPDKAALAADIELLHSLVGSASGRLILASFGQNPATGTNLAPKIEAFTAGDAATMTSRAAALAAEPHRNVYIALATMRADLPAGKKGGEKDIGAVYGIVADFDAKDDSRAHEWSARLPLAPTMVLETSSLPEPSFQCRYLFDEPVPVSTAKRLARALQSMSGCDQCSVDVSHVWRVSGGLNWPNKLKVEKHGRPGGAQPVRVIVPFDRTRLVSPARLAAALNVEPYSPAEPSDTSIAIAAPHVGPRVSLDDLDKWAVSAALKSIIVLGRDPDKPKKQDNSRSAWLFHAVRALKGFGVPAETILCIITNPEFKISESVLDKGRRYLDYARRQIARAEAEAADTILEAFNEEHAVVENYGSRTMMFSFDKRDRYSHRSFEDFKRSYDHRKLPIQRGDRTLMVGQGTAFIDNPNRRQYTSVIFLPGREAEDGVLNLYRGPSIQPRAGECGRFLSFVVNIICGGDKIVADWVLKFLAHLYQRPWETPEVCIILRGRQGVGKNFFVECIGGIVGDYFITIANPKHLVGGFNRHLMDKLVVFADEAFYGNERRYAGILKNLVTQSEMAVEPKGVDVFMAKKYFRLFMASNEDFVVPADLDDRRFLVLDVSDERAKDHVYFGELHAEWESGGREAFYDTMLGYDLTEFNHRDRPETTGLAEQKIESLIGADRLMFEMLSSGEAPVPSRQPGAYFIATESLRRLHAMRGLDVSSTSLATELAIIAMHADSKRENVHGSQARGFWVPELCDCRQIWAKAKRLPIEWPTDDGEWIDVDRSGII